MPTPTSCNVIFKLYFMHHFDCYSFTRRITINTAHLSKLLNWLINDSTESTNMCCFRCVQFNFFIRYRLGCFLVIFIYLHRFSNWQHSKFSFCSSSGERTDELLEPVAGLSRLIDKPSCGSSYDYSVGVLKMHSCIIPNSDENIYTIPRILNNIFSLITIRPMIALKHFKRWMSIYSFIVARSMT